MFVIETRRATVFPYVLAKLLKDADLNMTSSMSSQLRNGTSKSISFICEPDESFFKRVTTRTKLKPGRQNTLFNYIPEVDSSQADDESSTFIPEPVIEKSTVVLSPTENVVNLEINTQKLNQSTENICEDLNSKDIHGSAFVVAEVDKTPTQNRETEVSLKESPQIQHEATEEEPHKYLATTPKFLHVDTLETPPHLKQNAQGYSTITKRKNRNRTTFFLDLSKGKA